MSKKNPKALSVVHYPGQTNGQALAAAALSPTINAAQVVETYQANIMGNDVEIDALVGNLQASMNKSAASDLSGLEAMLIGQATALQTIFVSLAKRAHHQEYQRHFEAFLGLALKAQAQSRATIQAVIDLKFPRQATFVKQANIAHGPQQVNNGTPSLAHGENQATVQNELLEGQHHGQPGSWLDTGAAQAPKRGNQTVETVGKVHRAKDQ